MKQRKVLLLAIIGILLASLPVWPVRAASDAESGVLFLENSQNVFILLAKQITPSVVSISPADRFSHSSRGQDKKERKEGHRPESGTGSGVIIDKKGFILTNSHVVGDAEEVTVRLSNKSEFTGKVIGRDTDTDIAVVKIDAETDLPFSSLGNSKEVKVGQWAMAVGNPFGLDHTVTVGIVSGLGRENVNLSRYEDFIQTDASINPGNSGGPLFNIQGKVIGINTAIINVAQGIGFAIPSNMAQAISQQLIEKGKVTRGWLGVGIQPMTPELAEKFSVKEGEGVLVNEVFKGDPAEQGGVQPGDIILKVDDEQVGTTNTLARVIAGYFPGSHIRIELIRNGKKQQIEMTLGEKKGDATTVSIPAAPKLFLGLAVADLTPENIEKFKIKGEKGVVITEVKSGSPAELEGLKAGDLIQEIEGEQVATLNNFENATEKAEKTKPVLLRVNREGRSFYIVLKQEQED
jgi:serine protease Do